MFLFSLFTIADSPSEREYRPDVETLYGQYADMVYRIAFVRTLNASDAEDILQDVFCRYIRSNTAFADEGHCRAWLIRAAINCSSSLLTSAWRRHTVSGDSSAENVTCRMERDTEVYHAVMQLPEKQRVAVHLFYYEDYSVDKIARLTGSTVSAVKSRLHRAREELRCLLKEDFDEFQE